MNTLPKENVFRSSASKSKLTISERLVFFFRNSAGNSKRQFPKIIQNFRNCATYFVTKLFGHIATGCLFEDAWAT